MDQFMDEVNQLTPKKLALKEQEKELDQIRKENFALKLRVHYLEDSMNIDSLDMIDNNVKSKLREESVVSKEDTTATSDSLPAAITQSLAKYRDDIERLESELASTKAQLFEQNSAMAQRAVEMEQLKGENESFRIQMQNEIRSISPVLRDEDAQTQLEFGISILREQISELKMQLIEKSSLVDKLKLELESERKNSSRKSVQFQELKRADEIGRQRTVEELTRQMQRYKNELEEIKERMDKSNRSYQLEETQLQMDLQAAEYQAQKKQDKIIQLSEENDKIRASNRNLEASLELKKDLVEQLNRQLEQKSQLLQSAEKERVQVRDQLQMRIEKISAELKNEIANVGAKDNEIALLKQQLERQKMQLVQVEERWQRQAQEQSMQFKEIRQELDSQIQQFKVKSTQLAQQLADKENKLRAAERQLEMHSVGVEEATRRAVEDKERYKTEVREMSVKCEELEREIIRYEHRLEELDVAYKEAIASSDRMADTNELLEEKNKKLSEDILHKEQEIRKRDEVIGKKERIVKELEMKLIETENSLSETGQITKVIESRFSSHLEERNTLLVKINARLDEILEKQSIFIETDEKNYYAFSEGILEKIDTLKQLPIIAEKKTRRVEKRIEDGFSNLNERFEAKMKHLDKFERTVHEAVSVQQRLRDQLSSKQEQLHEYRTQISGLTHQLEIKEHELQTLKSETAINLSSEKAKVAEYEAKLNDADKLIKEKDRLIKEHKDRIQEYQDTITRSNFKDHRVTELNQHIKLLKEELEISQRQSAQLETMLKHQPKSSSMLSLLETSETALENLNNRLKDEAQMFTRQLDKERHRNQMLESQIIKMKSEIQSLKRRLERREAMIEMALSKLELVNHRKDPLEMNVLHQFTDDVKRLMRSRTSENLSRTDLERSRTNESLYDERLYRSRTDESLHETRFEGTGRGSFSFDMNKE